MVYRPVKPSDASANLLNFSVEELALTKVWYQHSRYFRKRGIRTSPEELFDEHLLAQLRTWRKDGEEIVLCGDFNQFAPLFNTWKGCDVADDAFQTSTLLHRLADGKQSDAHWM